MPISNRPTALSSGRRTRVGFVGAGDIAPEHAKALHLLGDIELAAVCDFQASRAKSLAAGATLLVYAILIAVFCPAYLRRAVPLALALYAATDVSLWQQIVDTSRLLFGEAMALVLWWSRRRRMPDRQKS